MGTLACWLPVDRLAAARLLLLMLLVLLVLLLIVLRLLRLLLLIFAPKLKPSIHQGRLSELLGIEVVLWHPLWIHGHRYSPLQPRAKSVDRRSVFTVLCLPLASADERLGEAGAIVR